MHVCVSGVCGSLKERRAGAKTWLVVENGSAAKYNNLWSPGMAGYPVSHGFSLPNHPRVIIEASRPVLPSSSVYYLCPAHRFIVPPPTVEVDGAISPMLQHRPAAASSLHITEYLEKEEKSLGTTLCGHAVNRCATI